jgi:pimeloyl-ACP methyl ester carboxylesterase
MVTTGTGFRATDGTVADHGVSAGPDHGPLRVVGGGPTLGADVADVFRRNLVVQTPAIYERFKALLPAMTPSDPAFLGRLDTWFSFPVDPLPAPFDRPTLFVLGRQDAVVGYRGAFGLMESYPRASVAVLDRAGHAAPWEQEGVFRALVDEWLTGVSSEVLPGRP